MKRAVLISLAAWIALFCAIALLRSIADGRDLPRESVGDVARSHRGQDPALEPLAEVSPRRIDHAKAARAAVPGDVGPNGAPRAADTGARGELPEEWIEEEIPSDDELLARAGLPTDTPLALRMGRFGPPDPLEVGAAELVLTLYDQATGERVRGEVVLWRLNAPANAYWTAGDQDVARAHVPPEGHTFTGLVSGEYRPVVLDERAAAPHHAPLHVSGRTAHELFVEKPRQRAVRIVVEDLGSPPPVVEARFRGVHAHPRVHVPPWVVARTIQPDFEEVIEFESFEDAPWFSETAWVALAPTAHGHDAGTLPEDTRAATVSHTIELRVGGVRRKDVVLRNPSSGDDAVLVFRLE